MKYLCPIHVLFLVICVLESSAQKGNSNSIDKIYPSADVMPVFPGGEAAMLEFISGNIHYPEVAKSEHIEGTVYVSFVVDTNGAIKNPAIIKGIGGGCNEEAIRVVSTMPNWSPGRNKGMAVAVQLTLPVEFKIHVEIKSEDNYTLGIKAAQAGNFESAINYFSLDIDQHPDHINAVYNRGASYFRLSQTEKACADWRRVVELGDTSVASMIAKYCEVKKDTIVANEPVIAPPSATHEDTMQRIAAETFKFPSRELIIQGSVLFPTGAYSDEFNPDVSNSSPEENITNNMEGETGGFGASSGFGVEIGEFFYYNRKPVQTAGGLKFVFLSVGMTPFSWSGDSNLIFSNADYKAMYNFSMKVGPCLRYIINKNFVVRPYYELCFTVNSRAEWHYDDDSEHAYYTSYNGQEYRVTYTNDHAYFKSGTGLGLKHELGANLSYRNFSLGASFNFGKIKYKSVQYKRSTDIVIDEYYPQTGHYNYLDTLNYGDDRKFEVKAPSDYVIISLGVLL